MHTSESCYVEMQQQLSLWEQQVGQDRRGLPPLPLEPSSWRRSVSMALLRVLWPCPELQGPCPAVPAQPLLPFATLQVPGEWERLSLPARTRPERWHSLLREALSPPRASVFSGNQKQGLGL